jgi:LPS sulfotransferase NodH
MFVDMVRQDKQALAVAAAAAAQKQQQQEQVKGTRPADLPVYGQEFMSRQ